MKKTKNTVGELIFGINPVLEVLKARRRKVITLYTTKPEPKGWSGVEALMPKYHVPIQYVTRDVLSRMVETTDHQGIVAWVHPLPVRKTIFAKEKSPLLLMLDGVQDPRNLGAILRSAYCTGINGVVLIKMGGSPLNAVAFKASAGLAEYLEIFIAPSVEDATASLKKEGYQLYLATFDGDNAATTEFKGPLCLVVGSEGLGISRSILKEGKHITLPQLSPTISYNVSVAAGLLCFLVGIQHSKIGLHP